MATMLTAIVIMVAILLLVYAPGSWVYTEVKWRVSDLKLMEINDNLLAARQEIRALGVRVVDYHKDFLTAHTVNVDSRRIFRQILNRMSETDEPRSGK